MTQDQNYIKQVQIKLGCSSQMETKIHLKMILHQLRNELSEEASDELINILPHDLMMIYLSGWSSKNDLIVSRHLDQFVDRLVKDDQESEHSIYRNEVDALRDTLIILLELDKRYSIQRYLPYTFCQELNQAITNEAA